MSLRRSIGCQGVAVAVAIAVGAIVATSGIAGGAPKTKRAETTIAAGEEGSATAKCKKKARAVSGGFEDPAITTADAELFEYVQTTTSQRIGKRRWTAGGINFDIEDPRVLAAEVYCSDELPKLKVKSATTTTATDIPFVGTATAECPRGSEAVAGGFSGEASAVFADATYPYESMRVGKRSWTVSARSDFEREAGLTAYAYCAKDKPRLKVRSATTSSTEDTALVSASSSCRRRELAISGGFAGHYDSTDLLSTVDVVRSLREGRRGWLTSAAARAGAEPVQLESFVYCLKKNALD